MTDANSAAEVLEIKGLTKSLGGRNILCDINLSVNSGEVFGFLGPNGSGKTTTIKLILGLLNIQKGEIKICGYDVRRDFEKAMRNVGGIIENPEMYKYLTGRENLMQYTRMYDDVPTERIEEVIKTVRLEERIDDRISKYSLGMRQRLGIAQAIIHKPKLLILDEPTNGLDPSGIKELRDIFKDLAHNKGCSVFVSSHMLAELELMCDRVCVIDRGVVVGNMTMDDVHSSSVGEKLRYTFVTDDGAKTAEILSSVGFEASSEGEKTFADLSHEGAADAASMLTSAGVRIYSMIPETKSLEDAFMEITKERCGRCRTVKGMLGLWKNESIKISRPVANKIILIIAVLLIAVPPCFTYIISRSENGGYDEYYYVPDDDADAEVKVYFYAERDTRDFFRDNEISQNSWRYSRYCGSYRDLKMKQYACEEVTSGRTDGTDRRISVRLAF